MAQAKFRLGTVVATPGALAALAAAGQNATEFLTLHASGEWGDLDAADRRLNDEAVAHEDVPDRRDRVLSSYRTAEEQPSRQQPRSWLAQAKLSAVRSQRPSSVCRGVGASD